jgi:hypothetical protein
MFDDLARSASSAPPVETLDPAGARLPAGAGPLDEELDRPLSEAEVLAWVEQTPLAGESAALLLELDPAGFDDTGKVRLAAQLQRLENAVAGHKIAAVAAFAATQHPPESATAGSPRPDFTDCEVAVALGLSQPAAQRVVSAARRLASQLPRTLATMSAGQLGYPAVLRIVEGSTWLTDAGCRRLEQLVVPKAAGKAPGKVGALVRRAVARIDADALTRKQRRADRESYLDVTVDDGSGTGTGWINARGSHLAMAVIRTAVHAWARARKAAGDPRSLDELHLAAFRDWSQRYLNGELGAKPTQHGAPIVINIAADLPTVLGLTNHPVEILGTGALIPAAALTDLIPDAGFRRLITDPTTGHLLDATPNIYRPTAALARYLQLLHVTSSGPNSTVPATEADLDHGQPFNPGRTTRDNLHPPNRKWHNAKTTGGWTVQHNPDRTWTWTSPHGLTHTTEPHDYRLGP